MELNKIKYDKVKTISVKIFLGFREEYSDHIRSINIAENICQEYCNNIGLCVTITPTNFIYKLGKEPGCIIGFINYPRFPKTKNEILSHAFKIGEKVKLAYKQIRISIMDDRYTYTI